MPTPRLPVSTLLLAPLLVSWANGAETSDRQRKAWADYRERTEARIGTELAAQHAFLASAFLKPGERATFESAIRLGHVPVVTMQTRTERGGPIDVPAAAVHHRLGGVLLPNTTLDAVLRFAQDYDGHARFFLDVERARLLRRRGDTFDIELLVRLNRPKRVRYRTEHTVTYRRLTPAREVSFSVATVIEELRGSTMIPEASSNPSGILKEMSSYWRFEQRPDGVIVECETINLSRDIPLLLRPFLSGYVQSIATDSLRRTLLNLREGFAGRRAISPAS